MDARYQAAVLHMASCPRCMSFGLQVFTGKVKKEIVDENLAMSQLCPQGFGLISALMSNSAPVLQGKPVIATTPLPRNDEAANEARRAETLRIMAEIEGEENGN